MKKESKKFKNTTIFWQPSRTYCLKMMISEEKKIPHGKFFKM
jgi:hypothetical protein